MGKDADWKRSRNKRQEIDEKRIKAAKAKKSMSVAIVLAVVVIGSLGGLAYYETSKVPTQQTYQPSTPITQQPQPQGNQNVAVNEVTIPLGDVTMNVKFYTYDSSGVNVRFFAAKGSDGNAHVATDACDVCYGQKKGYRQTGNVLTCNNCGKTFAINSVGTENTAGGCWPSYIPVRIENGNVLVRKADLDGKRFMFA
ncbi:MAG: DUF2318 domain-containing protein [Euryarchaeota archaeon]|nr:DUF2318 domain-containing protein [Euryarchaeota archaeon]